MSTTTETQPIEFPTASPTPPSSPSKVVEEGEIEASAPEQTHRCEACGVEALGMDTNPDVQRKIICSFEEGKDAIANCTSTEHGDKHQTVYICSPCTKGRKMTPSDIRVFYGAASIQFRNYLAKEAGYKNWNHLMKDAVYTKAGLVDIQHAKKRYIEENPEKVWIAKKRFYTQKDGAWYIEEVDETVASPKKDQESEYEEEDESASSSSSESSAESGTEEQVEVSQSEVKELLKTAEEPLPEHIKGTEEAAFEDGAD